MQQRKIVREKPKTILVVIPVHNEELTIEKTVENISTELESMNLEFYFSLVDDGSTDRSWEKLQTLSEQKIPLVNSIKFSRNFGKDAAILAGLKSQECDLYLVIDADGEHPVSSISELYKVFISSSIDVVHGIKSFRRGSRLYSFFSYNFNVLFKLLTGLDLIESSDFKLFNKQFREALLQYGDYDYFFRGVAQDIGFQSAYLQFKEIQCENAESSWSTKKLFKYAVNSIVSFTSLPLYFILFLGIVAIFLSLIIGVKIVINYYSGIVPDGYSTLVVLLLISLGITMTSIGIVGFYMSKIFDAVKGRPRYIISKQITNRKNE